MPDFWERVAILQALSPDFTVVDTGDTWAADFGEVECIVCGHDCTQDSDLSQCAQCGFDNFDNLAHPLCVVCDQRIYGLHAYFLDESAETAHVDCLYNRLGHYVTATCTVPDMAYTVAIDNLQATVSEVATTTYLTDNGLHIDAEFKLEHTVAYHDWLTDTIFHLNKAIPVGYTTAHRLSEW